MAIPLDPGKGGCCIIPEALQMADIVVSTTSDLTSTFIRLGTWSDVSHAALYVSGGEIVEAVPPRVRSQSLATALKSDTLAVAYRKPGITRLQQVQVRDFIEYQINKGYNYLGPVGQGIGAVEKVDVLAEPLDPAAIVTLPLARMVVDVIGQREDRFFCSQLVLAAFRAAGVPLDSTPPYRSNPGLIPQLYARGRLAYVGHLKV